jgi:hypothetical protein
VAPVRVHARVDKEIQFLHRPADVAVGERLVTISQTRAEVVSLQEVGGQGEEGIGRNPFPGVDSAEEQNAVDVRAACTADAEDMALAALMGGIRERDQLGRRGIRRRQVLQRRLDLVHVEVSHGVLLLPSQAPRDIASCREAVSLPDLLLPLPPDFARVLYRAK